MDLVRDFEKAFDGIKNNPIKDVAILVEVIKKHAESDDSKLRWDVMRSVVSEDIDYLKLITEAELEHVYAAKIEVIKELPAVLDIIVSGLHTHYETYKKLVDVTSIQKRVFGPDIFAQIEVAMAEFLDGHCTRMVADNPYCDKPPLEFAKDIYKMYAQDYKDYYFWPQMQGPMEKVIFNLS